MELGYTPPKCSASEAIEEGMHEYGKYLATSKPPHELDGLKNVQRRILYAQFIEKKELLVGVPLLGRIMEFHSHSDAPIWDALARISRECAVNNVLLHCDGNVGAYTNPVPGAPRYPKFTKEPFAQDLFFNNVHPLTIPMVETDNFGTKEPEYLIPLIPSAFLFPDTTIGLGFKTVLAPIAVSDICELTKRYLDARKGCFRVSEEFFRKNAKYLIPEFPTGSLLRNYDELLKAYKEGHFEHKIVIDGEMDVLNNGYVLRTAAFDHKFHDIKTGIFDTIRKRGTWLNEYYVSHEDNSGSGINKKISAEFILTFKRGADPFKHLDDFKSLSKFTHHISPLRHYTSQGGKIRKHTPSTLFDFWYLEKCKSFAGGIKHSQSECIRELLALHAKCIACDHSEAIAKLIKENKKREVVLPILIRDYELTPYQALIVYNSPIHSFSEETKQEMHVKIEEQRKKATALTEDITRIPELLYREVDQFQKKYGRNYRRTKLPDFMGYVHVSKYDGIIQFSTMDEALEILDSFSNAGSKIRFYHPNSLDKILVLNSKVKPVEGCIPKQTTGSEIIEVPNRSCYTLCISEGTVSYVKGIRLDTYDPTVMQCFIVTSEFVGIHQDGTLEKMNISDMTLRKKIGRKGTRTTLIGVIPSTCADSVIFHMNDAEPDVVRWDRLTFGVTPRMTNVPMGNMKILDIVPSGSMNRIINLDSSCMTAGLEYIHVADLNKLVGTQPSSKILLNRKIARHSTLKKMALV